MSHGAVLTKLRHGFHRHGIPWGFNADHQPIGGKYDAREDALVRGSLFATYITFDISHELVVTEVRGDKGVGRKGGGNAEVWERHSLSLPPPPFR